MKIFKGQIVICFFIAALGTCTAGETYTNWDGLYVGLVIPKTNVVFGDEIRASIVISNSVEKEHIVRWQTGDSCSCGFGTFEIVEVSSGKQIECKFSREERGHIIGSGSVHLQPHQSRVFSLDLMNGYAISNAGPYSVTASRWFPLNEPPTNNQYMTVTTPPVFIFISPKPETNAPPK